MNESRAFTRAFLEETRELISRLDIEAIEKMVATLVDLRERGGRLFFVGSGGGAGHASHAVNDFRRVAGIEAYTPTDNASELTARINDEGWDASYVNWLRASRFGKNDALFVFSVGGGDADRGVSVNLVQCLRDAREIGAPILGVVGRDGGYTAKVADAVVVVPQLDPRTVTAQTEGLQAVVWHLLVAHPRLRAQEMRWESMR